MLRRMLNRLPQKGSVARQLGSMAGLPVAGANILGSMAGLPVAGVASARASASAGVGRLANAAFGGAVLGAAIAVLLLQATGTCFKGILRGTLHAAARALQHDGTWRVTRAPLTSVREPPASRHGCDSNSTVQQGGALTIVGRSLRLPVRSGYAGALFRGARRRAPAPAPPDKHNGARVFANLPFAQL
eukprot:1575947-Prymnesium_polylepis.2